MITLKFTKTLKKGRRLSNLENDYVLVFYNEDKIVGATSCVGTMETVATLGEVLVNSTGDYLPNNGIYDTVGWVKSTSIDTILSNAISESHKIINTGDDYDNSK